MLGAHIGVGFDWQHARLEKQLEKEHPGARLCKLRPRSADGSFEYQRVGPIVQQLYRIQ